MIRLPRIGRFDQWVYILSAAALAGAALLFTTLPRETGIGGALEPDPSFVILTNQRDVSVQYAVAYHLGSTLSPGELTLGPTTQSLPIGVRELRIDFQAPRTLRTLRYALLFNPDASTVKPVLSPGLATLRVSAPGTGVDTECSSIKEFAPAQVLSGRVLLDTSGRGEVTVVGRVPRDVVYRRQGERTQVIVLDLLPPYGEGTLGGAQTGGCLVGISDWPVVGDSTWITPRIATGQVNVGNVPPSDIVESANPPLHDPTRLEWNIDGPASVSYTLFDTNLQARHGRFLFVAGIFAGIAGAFFVEFIKSLLVGGLPRPEVGGASGPGASFSAGAASQPRPPSEGLAEESVDSGGSAQIPGSVGAAAKSRVMKPETYALLFAGVVIAGRAFIRSIRR